ncbi:MAG: ATP-binding protein, partial [Actinomycetota bacterium]
VLDNFEQVLGAAGVVPDLLDGSSGLRILVTSREPLHVAGEQEYPVTPLSVPEGSTPGAVAGSEAVALFVERAAAVDPSFELTDENAGTVGELCSRLDGLPLAIELAASRVKMLPPSAILQRLEHRLELLTGGSVDVPQRQRTLREAIAWSHDLLHEDERTLFRRLSVFAGGWDLDSAEAVAGSDDVGRLDVFEVLGSLVDKSLVRRLPAAEDARFGMLESIREFAAQELDASGEADAVRDRHAATFLSLAELAEPQLRSTDQVAWLDRLELEHDNLRTALGWIIERGNAPMGMRLAWALWRFWHLHSHLADGRRWAEAMLALPGAEARTPDRLAGLNSFGGLAYWQQDVAAFRPAYEEALDIARELRDRRAEAEGLYNLCFAFALEGDFPTTISLVEQSTEMAKELDMPQLLGDCVWLLGIAARVNGDLPRSRELAEESLRIHRERGDVFGETVCLFGLGRTAWEQGDLDIGRSSFLQALDYDERISNRTGMTTTLDNLAAQASGRGEHLRALRLAGASDALKESVGGRAPDPLIDLPDPREAARAELGDAAVGAAWEEG